MTKLHVVPYPQKIKNLGGSIKLKGIDPLTVEVKRDLSLRKDSYFIRITPTQIYLAAADSRAEFYLRQTLIQLTAYGECPCVEIEDYPEFAYRGFMLDCARHITSIENTKKLIDAAALVKMNYMHWHLTDDQGFRIELNSHPEITKIGSVRESSDFGKYHRNEPYSGYFTKDEIKEIVEYAKERYIEVVPEFDIPGHNLALLASHPELSCKASQIKVGTKQGISDDILCAGNDDAIKVVFDILNEMCELFPSKYFHLGGDEVPKKRWKECPKCQARIKAENLKDEEELQGWFVNKAIDFLRERGKEPMVWNEGINNKTPDDCIAQRWMDKKNLTAKYANSGKNVLVSDFYYYYCDYPYGMTSVKKTYNYTPYFKGLNETGRKHILGIETPIWTEYISDFEKLCYMCFPRFTAAAETGWTNKNSKNYKSFSERFASLARLYKEIGINPADPSEWNPNPIKSMLQVINFRKGTK